MNHKALHIRDLSQGTHAETTQPMGSNEDDAWLPLGCVIASRNPVKFK
jgi:hypothetical protein